MKYLTKREAIIAIMDGKPVDSDYEGKTYKWNPLSWDDEKGMVNGIGEHDDFLGLTNFRLRSDRLRKELWVNFYEFGPVSYFTKEEAEASASKYITRTAVHMREVEETEE